MLFGRVGLYRPTSQKGFGLEIKVLVLKTVLITSLILCHNKLCAWRHDMRPPSVSTVDRAAEPTVDRACRRAVSRVVGLESWTWTQVGLESDFLRTWTGLGLEGQGLEG